jgi:RimJ/RimL family protein N-acetyltransferase
MEPMQNPTSFGPTLETARLALRPPTRQHFDALAEILSDAETMHHLGGALARSAAWRNFEGLVGGWALLGFGMFMVFEKESGILIGRVGPLMPEGHPGPEVGWVISRNRWGRGYATEAAATCMDYAFDALGWTRVVHCIAPENLPSIHVAQRLGSVRIGETDLPPPLQHVHLDVYGQTREDWRALKER